jgi:hypothetical protein
MLLHPLVGVQQHIRPGKVQDRGSHGSQPNTSARSSEVTSYAAHKAHSGQSAGETFKSRAAKPVPAAGATKPTG